MRKAGVGFCGARAQAPQQEASARPAPCTARGGRMCHCPVANGTLARAPCGMGRKVLVLMSHFGTSAPTTFVPFRPCARDPAARRGKTEQKGGREHGNRKNHQEGRPPRRAASRVLSALMAVVLALGMMPGLAFADGEAASAAQPQSQQMLTTSPSLALNAQDADDEAVPPELQLSSLTIRASNSTTSDLLEVLPAFDPAVKNYTVVASCVENGFLSGLRRMREQQGQ